ncbi:MAG: T9SS type A sorting domain-containing protein [Saprospiraceae bacterium]|nr:T9SS type A sorting domain-containing protein [Saprospiraceae bacterium]
MKKLYSLFVLALCAYSINAQTISGATACKKASGEISIVFDVSKNCSSTPAGSKDTLGKRTEIGFHSGANDWSKGVDWNATGAVRAKRMVGTSGNTAKFHVTIANPTTYYGLAAAPTNIKFVFNDGPANASTPWGYEGKSQGASGCEDFLFAVASMPTCAASSQDLRASINSKVAPNPFKERTYIMLDGGQGKSFNVSLMDNVGRTVRTYNNVVTETLEIERGNLSTGIYFAVIRDQEGRSLTEKLVVQ